MKKNLLLLLVLTLLLPFSTALSAMDSDPLANFVIHNGPRDEKKVAITVDDFFDLEWGWKIRDLLHEYDVKGTFFPCGVRILPEDGPQWQLAIDYGIEIGSHNWGHYRMGNSNTWSILFSLGRTQQALDAALGYHYQINSFRPPEGNTSGRDKDSGMIFRMAVNHFGYAHVVLWDVSQTDPRQALWNVQNGSILLYHARRKDYYCLKELIPALLDQGYELVTVSELLGFGENEISPEPYVYRKEDYQAKK